MHRIMLGLSISDILAGIAFFGSTWPIPEGIVPRRGLGMVEQPIYGAVGTDASCNMAGFFSQFQVAIPLFNATLGTYFLLTVYYGWNEQRIKRVEWLFYVLPLGYALFTTTYAVAADLIGHVEWSCWILP